MYTEKDLAGLTIEKARTELSRMHDEVGHIRETAGGFDKITGDDAEKVRDLSADLDAVGRRFDELVEAKGLEDRYARLEEVLKAPAGSPVHPASAKAAKIDLTAGALFVKSDALAAARSGRIGQEFEIKGINDLRGVRAFTQDEAKAVLGTDSAIAGVDTDAVPPTMREPGIVPGLYGPQPTSVLDLIVEIPTDASSAEYLVESAITSNAGETQEAATITEASYDTELRTDAVRKITAAIPITEEELADLAGLEGTIRTRLADFLDVAEASAMLAGDGIAPNIEGILSRTGIQNQAQGGDSLIDAAHKAMTLTRRATGGFSTPNGYVMNAGTWEEIRLSKDGSGAYLFGPPSQAVAPRLWGLAVVNDENVDDATTGLKAILVGDFRQAQRRRKQGVVLSVSDSHGTRFLDGILTLKATKRVALAVYRPQAFATVTAA